MHFFLIYTQANHYYTLCSYHNDLTSPIRLSSLKAETEVGVGVSGCPGLGHGFDTKRNRKVTFSFFDTLKNSGCACTDKQRSEQSSWRYIKEWWGLWQTGSTGSQHTGSSSAPVNCCMREAQSRSQTVCSPQRCQVCRFSCEIHQFFKMLVRIFENTT